MSSSSYDTLYFETLNNYGDMLHMHAYLQMITAKLLKKPKKWLGFELKHTVGLIEFI
jgi:hypothetical protein